MRSDELLGKYSPEEGRRSPDHQIVYVMGEGVGESAGLKHLKFVAPLLACYLIT